MAGDNHTAPCTWMKALLGFMSVGVLIIGICMKFQWNAIREARAENRMATDVLDGQVMQIQVDTRARAIDAGRFEERLAAIQQSLTRIERELEHLKTNAP